MSIPTPRDEVDDPPDLDEVEADPSRTQQEQRPETDGPGPSSDDATRAPETLGIDNTDTALSPEDESTPVE